MWLSMIWKKQINNCFSFRFLFNLSLFIFRNCINILAVMSCSLLIQIVKKDFVTIWQSVSRMFVILRNEHFTPESSVHYWFNSKFNIGMKTICRRSSITLVERETHLTGRETIYMRIARSMHHAQCVCNWRREIGMPVAPVATNEQVRRTCSRKYSWY